MEEGRRWEGLDAAAADEEEDWRLMLEEGDAEGDGFLGLTTDQTRESTWEGRPPWSWGSPGGRSRRRA